MTVSEIRYSELDSRFMNAEFYSPRYIRAQIILENIRDIMTLEEISNSLTSGSYVDEYVQDGTLYLRVNNVQEYEIDYKDVKFVDLEKSQIPDKIRIRPNDIILTRTGTIGIAYVAPEKLSGSVISQHLTRIEIKDQIDPFYVAAFLNTDLGRSQTERGGSGSMQKELIHDMQRSIKIPVLDTFHTNMISNQVKSVYQKAAESQQLQSKLEEKLLGLLGLSSPTLLNVTDFETCYSNVKKSGRLDAEYFQPKYSQITEEIDKHRNLSTLREISTSITHLREFKREFTSEGIGYLRVQNIVNGYIDDTNMVFVPEQQVVELGLSRLEEDDILVARSGTLGVAAYVPEKYAGYCASADFLKVTLKRKVAETGLDAVYVTTYLNSAFGSLQLEQSSIGAVQKHTTGEALSQVRIPIPAESVQAEIRTLADKIHELRNEARREYAKLKQSLEEMVTELSTVKRNGA